MSQGDEPIDLALARAIKDLPKEMTPSRDLWAGIERNIAEHPQKAKREWSRDWMPYGIAASLFVAVMSLGLNVYQMTVPVPELVSVDRSMDRMAMEYIQVRNPMVVRFNEANKELAPETLDDVYKNLQILEQARRELEAQVRENPEDQRLVAMLMRLQEQELELLRQDFTRPTRSL